MAQNYLTKSKITIKPIGLFLTELNYLSVSHSSLKVIEGFGELCDQ